MCTKASKCVRIWFSVASDFNKADDSSNPFVSVAKQLDRSLETAEEDRFVAVRQGLIDAVQIIRPTDWEKPGRLATPVIFPPAWSMMMLASCSDDEEIRLWNQKTGESLRTLAGHDMAVHSVAFSPDGSMLASSEDIDDESFQSEIRLWGPKTGEPLRTLTGHSGNVRSVAFSPDGSMLASGSDDKENPVVEPKNG